MARASHVYIVHCHRNVIQAAFTVKHECVTWLDKRVKGGNSVEGWWVVRHPDGRSVAIDDPVTRAAEFLETSG